MKTQITLSKEEISDAIEDWLLKAGYVITTQIRFDFGIRDGGVAYDEHEVAFFDGATVDVEKQTF